jgi:hypothetical protein
LQAVIQLLASVVVVVVLVRSVLLDNPVEQVERDSHP